MTVQPDTDLNKEQKMRDLTDHIKKDLWHPQKKKISSIFLLLKYRIRIGFVFTTSTITGLLLATNFHPQLIQLVTVPLITLFATLAVYWMNDITDIKLDKINAANRPLAGGQVKKSEAIVLLTALSLVALWFAYSVNFTTLLFTSAYLIIGILYSSPKISLKDRFVLKTLSISIGGFTTTLIGASINGTLDGQDFISAISFMMLLFVTSPINDLGDYPGDKECGRKTIPIVIGKKNTIFISIAIPFFMMMSFWFFYPNLGFSIKAPVAMTVLASISFLILRPMLSHLNDYKYIKSRHKKSLLLYYGLQASLLIGAL
ncbi:MAG: UbiA prenyltransferase family protein [Nitrosotalea sp.]